MESLLFLKVFYSVISITSNVKDNYFIIAAIYLLICAKQCSRYFTRIVLLLNLKTVFHGLSKGSEQEGILEKFKRNTFFL